jgi:hypothetical protein
LVQLSSLDGNSGFRLDGVTTADYSGNSVSAAGDINGDGVDDLIIGSFGADPNGNRSGSVHVILGRRTGGFASAIDLSSLDGSNGFRLDGAAAGDEAGYSVAAAGDINGDGVDDLIIGARGVDLNGNNSGSAYLVFGRSTSGFEPVISLSALDGSSGFRVDGVAAGDASGLAVSAAGDINHDGIDDLMIGAWGTDTTASNAGSSYVVFGRSASGFNSAISLSSLNGSNGFRLDGVGSFDRAGVAVAAAGDINGDGIDDLTIGAYGTNQNGIDSGSTYVVFGRGKAGFSSAINLSSLNGSTGFRLDGVAPRDYSGQSVSGAGDINGDGVDDLLIGALGADPNGERSGSSYVVFGRSTGAFASVIGLSSLDGSTGFRLDGIATDDDSGRCVSGAGDVNGDGVDDLIIGAFRADPNGSYSGSSYVVFGRTSAFASAINLSSLDGSTGFRLEGAAEGDQSGRSVSAAGDVNHDGVDDLIIGAYRADPNGNLSGSSYVLFGRGKVIFSDGFEDGDQN